MFDSRRYRGVFSLLSLACWSSAESRRFKLSKLSGSNPAPSAMRLRRCHATHAQAQIMKVPSVAVVAPINVATDDEPDTFPGASVVVVVVGPGVHVGCPPERLQCGAPKPQHRWAPQHVCPSPATQQVGMPADTADEFGLIGTVPQHRRALFPSPQLLTLRQQLKHRAPNGCAGSVTSAAATVRNCMASPAFIGPSGYRAIVRPPCSTVSTGLHVARAPNTQTPKARSANCSSIDYGMSVASCLPER